MSDHNCIFCKIVNGELPTKLVYQDSQCIAFNDIHPKAPVHLLVISRKHIESLKDTQPSDGQLLSNMLMLLPKLALEQGLTEGFRTICNTGPGGGQEINHLHFHILGGGGRLPGF